MTRLLAAFLLWYLRSEYHGWPKYTITPDMAARIAAEWLRSIGE